MKWLSGLIVVSFALFLVGLAGTIVGRPTLARRFLDAFAQSARVHYAEQGLRLLVGSAFILFSPQMWQSGVFRLFGWIMVVTTLGLLCVPWQWHRRFAGWVVPPVTRHLKLFALAVVALAALVLYAVFAGSASGAA